jgi:hypothetical protein
MGVAANGLAAVPVVCQKSSLVADADLSHLDASPEDSCQVLYQFTEVDALLGEVIENHPLATEDRFNVDQIHLKTAIGNMAQANRVAFPLDVSQEFPGTQIVGRRRSQNLAARRVLEEPRSHFTGWAQYVTQFDAPISLQHDLLPA